MKILLNPQISNLNFKSSPLQDYRRLGGAETFENYEKRINDFAADSNRKYQETQNVIYNSLQALAAYGKYDVAKVLFKEVEQEELLKDDYIFYNLMGNMYKNENDMLKASELYKTAMDNANPDDGWNYLNIEKNYLESLINRNENVDNRLEFLKQRNIPLSKVYYYELKSMLDLKNGNKNDSIRDILTAYFLASNNNISSPELEYKAALALSSTGEYEASTEICKKNLDYLDKNSMIYTHEFLNFITLLGINNFKSAKNPDDYTKAYDTLKNALDIENRVHDDLFKEAIDYNLLKLFFKMPHDKNYQPDVNAFLKNCKNPDFKKDICYEAGVYWADKKEDELALIYFDSYEQMLLADASDNKKELLRFYTEQSKRFPDKSSEYDKKINSLDINTGLSLKQMLNKLEANLNDGGKILEISKDIMNDENVGALQKEIANTFGLFAKLNSTNDNFENSAADIENNLALLCNMNFNLMKELGIKETEKASNPFLKIYQKYGRGLKKVPELSDSDKNQATLDILTRHLYMAYKNLATIYYDASRTSDAARAQDSAVRFARLAKLSDVEMAKQKVLQTLMLYKQKNYYMAENACLEFMEILIGAPASEITTKDPLELVKNRSDEDCRKIAAAFETLGVINLKNQNYKDSEQYYQKAVKIRHRLRYRDIYLANDYSALARLKILGFWSLSKDQKSVELHDKCLQILKDKYPGESFTRDEEMFHSKYYGCSLPSVMKFFFFRSKTEIVNKFKCYNRELNLCE